jgi:hypothetical protein
MNSKLIELAEQSGFYYTPKTGFITPAGCDPAKFAELIVSECMEACSRVNETRSLVPPTRLAVVLDCMREIETTLGFRK